MMVSVLHLVPISVEADEDSLAAAESGGFGLSVGRFRHWIFLSAAESVNFSWRAVSSLVAGACFGGG